METVAIDFDGVIHDTAQEFEREDKIPGTLIEGAREFIAKLREKYAVIVFTSRARTLAGKNAVRAWLAKNAIEVDGIYGTKIPAKCYVDDRAIRFDGDFNKAEGEIDTFKPWHEEMVLEKEMIEIDNNIPSFNSQGDHVSFME
jgi:hypothetical protein